MPMLKISNKNMMKITYWDANVFLCLIEWGLPEEVVKGMLRVVKKVHEEFSLDQASRYWNTNSPTLVRWRVTQPLERRGVSFKFQINGTLEFTQTRLHVFKRRFNMTKEFKKEWRLRSIEDRQAKVMEWCKFGDERGRLRHQGRLRVYTRDTNSSYTDNLWQSWDAWTHCEHPPMIYDENTVRPQPWDRRVYVSQWYEGIHPGRFFLFYKENKIIEERNRGFKKGPCEDGYQYPKTPIFDWGPYEQLIEDLRCIDGGGLGESVGGTVEHIDDIFI